MHFCSELLCELAKYGGSRSIRRLHLPAAATLVQCAVAGRF